MRERLFGPAGMTRSTYAWSAERQRDTAYGHRNRGAVARQYNREIADPLLELAAAWGKPMSDWTAADVFRAMDETKSQLPRLPNFAVPNVAGSLICTAGEYAMFLATMLAGGPHRDWAISEPSRTAMLAPRVGLNPALSWGLGWGLETTDRGPLFWHWGDNGPFTAFAVGDPARRRALVVFTNSESGPRIYQRVVADATGMDLAAFLWV
jgi:CubicO group peptidase (beta-lactamase class C family)